MHRGILISAALCLAAALFAGEQEALEISRTIQSRHLPHGAILEPIFAAPDSDRIVNYTRCGDSAIWTGHYLAAETFRYAATRSPEAFDNAVRAVGALKTLVDVTGTNLLARCAFPADSPWAAGMLSEEAHHGSYDAVVDGRAWKWIGNTSRDQYSGAFFGLSIAYDGLGDEAVRSGIRDLVTRMLDFLRYHDWNVVMPDGRISTTFLGRFDQELSFLAVGAQVHPDRFRSPYRRSRLLQSWLVAFPIWIEVLDPHDSYFKFNLDTINLYDLVRLEDSAFYRDVFMNSYSALRHTTDGHGNAHFNMIDRSLRGPDERRDEETRQLLAAWLERPRRDLSVDWRGTYAECGPDRACEPIPVKDRVRTDFLWQRSPFQLSGGGDGLIETSGIDYILPYWMARFYSVLSD
jgi:hypothetical protein